MLLLIGRKSRLCLGNFSRKRQGALTSTPLAALHSLGCVDLLQPALAWQVIALLALVQLDVILPGHMRRLEEALRIVILARADIDLCSLDAVPVLQVVVKALVVQAKALLEDPAGGDGLVAALGPEGLHGAVRSTVMREHVRRCRHQLLLSDVGRPHELHVECRKICHFAISRRVPALLEGPLQDAAGMRGALRHVLVGNHAKVVICEKELDDVTYKTKLRLIRRLGVGNFLNRAQKLILSHKMLVWHSCNRDVALIQRPYSIRVAFI